MSSFSQSLWHRADYVLTKRQNYRTVYLNPLTNEVWNTGDSFTEPCLAQTLDIIAKEGPEAIHNGSLTASLVRDIQKLGGIITEDDLRNYRYGRKLPVTNKTHKYFNFIRRVLWILRF